LRFLPILFSSCKAEAPAIVIGQLELGHH
jgi:hypothetical protein